MRTIGFVVLLGSAAGLFNSWAHASNPSPVTYNLSQWFVDNNPIELPSTQCFGPPGRGNGRARWKVDSTKYYRDFIQCDLSDPHASDGGRSGRRASFQIVINDAPAEANVIAIRGFTSLDQLSSGSGDRVRVVYLTGSHVLCVVTTVNGGGMCNHVKPARLKDRTLTVCMRWLKGPKRTARVFAGIQGGSMTLVPVNPVTASLESLWHRVKTIGDGTVTVDFAKTNTTCDRATSLTKAP